LAGPAGSEPSLRFTLDQLIQRTFEEASEITAWQRMAQQLSGFLDLDAEFGAGRELHRPARRRQWSKLTGFSRCHP
jgi:hypothetical protein